MSENEPTDSTPNPSAPPESTSIANEAIEVEAHTFEVKPCSCGDERCLGQALTLRGITTNTGQVLLDRDTVLSFIENFAMSAQHCPHPKLDAMITQSILSLHVAIDTLTTSVAADATVASIEIPDTIEALLGSDGES